LQKVKIIKGEFLISTQQIEKKLRKLNKSSTIDFGIYINNLLTGNLQDFSIEEQTLMGSMKDLKNRLKELLYVLQRTNPPIYNQAIKHINKIEEKTVSCEKKEKTSKINGSFDGLYIERLNEIFFQIFKKIIQNDLKFNLTKGFNYFLKWNRLNYLVKIDKFENLFQVKYEIQDEDAYFSIKDFEEIQDTLNKFFNRLNLIEIKILLIGFCFWGSVNKLLKDLSEIIYITIEKVPLINLKIFEILAAILRERDNKSKSVNKFDVSEIYSNIYDKTEGFDIKIEPWLIN
jgi:hypothetical protein